MYAPHARYHVPSLLSWRLFYSDDTILRWLRHEECKDDDALSCMADRQKYRLVTATFGYIIASGAESAIFIFELYLPAILSLSPRSRHPTRHRPLKMQNWEVRRQDADRHWHWFRDKPLRWCFDIRACQCHAYLRYYIRDMTISSMIRKPQSIPRFYSIYIEA